MNAVKEIKIGEGLIGGCRRFMLIAGPCVMESEELVMNVAKEMVDITKRLGIDFVFKSSFDKANRSSIHSYRGPGIEEGMRILSKVKDTYNIPVTTDVHEVEQIKKIAEVVDIIQIPAFLCRQTDLLVAAAETGKVVNVKKGQFLAPWDMKNVVKKLEEVGNKNIILTERGTTFGYNNLVVDMRGLIEMRSFGYPVVFDATHSVQKPGGRGDTTGGDREFVYPLMRAAIGIGIDGIFAEVHPDPDNAKSDGPNMLKLCDVEKMLHKLIKIDDVIKTEG